MGKAFVSYASADSKEVDPLVRHLRDAGHEVFYARSSVDEGDSSVHLGCSFALDISEGLAASDAYVIVLSRGYHASPWCKRELGAIIVNSITTRKQLIVVRMGDVEVPPILSDMQRVDVTRGPFPADLSRRISEAIERRPQTKEQLDIEPRTHKLVERLLEANALRQFGVHLLAPSHVSAPGTEPAGSVPRNEGVILIKPGGTFHVPCLSELFTRILRHCDIHQLRLFDGPKVAEQHLFEQQYLTSMQIATGELPLDEEDYRAIRAIYAVPEFKRRYGVPYGDALVVPAMKLCDAPYKLDAEIISKQWENGRKPSLFWNRRWDGLNKIGYQKTVFPIEFSRDSQVCIVLNGFIPGYRRLFVSPEARVVALHVSTTRAWAEVRERLVGGKSNPSECAVGSIRGDAWHGTIPLHPADALVNGQRNVCHSSATVFDGMRELGIWFGHPPEQTRLGSLLQLKGVSPGEIQEKTGRLLSDVSWTTRDEAIEAIVRDVRHRIVLDDVRGTAGLAIDSALNQYAEAAAVPPERIRNDPELLEFVRNGHRLAVAKDDFFATLLADMFASAEDRLLFFEVAEAIRRQASDGVHTTPVEVRAEAYRIAASDLRFLQCPAYADLASPRLFRCLMHAELPSEALACAVRTRENLVKHVAVQLTAPRTYKPQFLNETTAWREFLERVRTLDRPEADIVALILAGGRSTRMSSTIPKPVLPFKGQLLFDAVLNIVNAATHGRSANYAAIGFRAPLLRYALGEKVRFLEYGPTHGLAFRVATCLEFLRNWDGPVLVAYTDMPLVSAATLKALIDEVMACAGDTFGFLTSEGGPLSGYVDVQDGKVRRVIQKRLQPDLCRDWMPRDVGMYVFRNSPRFRAALGRITDNNARSEFILADVIEILAQDTSWNVITHTEPDAYRAQGINCARDLLDLASGAYHYAADRGAVSQVLEESYGLKLGWDVGTLRANLGSHRGPLYCLGQWEKWWE